MKRVKLNYICIIFIFVCVSFFGDALLYAKSIVISNSSDAEEMHWDFGRAKEGIVLKHVFVLSNYSGSVLTIKDVTTSCGCTVSKVKKKVLEPEESTSIEVSVNTKGYSGKIKQFVYISTDNIEVPVMRFVVEAEVIK